MYEKRAKGFGWHVVSIDGHDIRAIAAELEVAQQVKDKPTLIIAKTFKGHDFPGAASFLVYCLIHACVAVRAIVFEYASRTTHNASKFELDSILNEGISNQDDWHGKALGQKSEAVLQHLLTRVKRCALRILHFIISFL